MNSATRWGCRTMGKQVEAASLLLRTIMGKATGEWARQPLMCWASTTGSDRNGAHFDSHCGPWQGPLWGHQAGKSAARLTTNCQGMTAAPACRRLKLLVMLGTAVAPAGRRSWGRVTPHTSPSGASELASCSRTSTPVQWRHLANLARYQSILSWLSSLVAVRQAIDHMWPLLAPAWVGVDTASTPSRLP